MVKRVTPPEADALLKEGWAYVDVRSIPEFEGGHPAGALNIPLLHMAGGRMAPNPAFQAVVEGNFPKDAKIVVGCKMGGRSQQACEILSSAGYQDVANVLGGFGGAPQMGHRGWLQEGLPVEQTSDPAHEYASLQKKASGDR